MQSETAPNPWDLALWRQSGGGQRSRRFGHAEEANWLGKDKGNREREVVSLGVCLRTHPQELKSKTSSDINLLRAKNGLDNGDHFTPLSVNLRGCWYEQNSYLL